MGTFLEREYISIITKGIIIKPLSGISGQPRLRDTVAKRAAARSSGGSSPSVQKSSPRHNAPPSSAPTAFSFTQNQSSPLKPIRQNVVVIDLTSEEEVEADSPAKVNADEEGHYELSNGSSRPRIVGPESLRSGGAFRPGDQPLRRAVRSPLKRQVVESDSDEDDLPLLSIESKKATENVPIKTDDQSEDDDDVFSPRKTRKAKHNEPTNTDRKPLVAPILTNRLKRAVELDTSDEDIVQEPLSSPTKRRRLVRRGGASSPVNEDTDEDHGLTTRPPPSSAARRKPRTEKEKARELLRRKRAGEVIDEEEESSEEEDKKPLYDSDPDHEVLCEFLDDDEGVLEIPEPEPKDKSPVKKSQKKKGRTIESGSDSDVNTEANSSGDEKSGDVESGDDWLVEDDHIGVPDEVMNQIPLEFTGHSHKPLKDHFRDVIEWYVLRRINPGFVEKWNKLYRIGFDKLDEQVIGLARSKFSSAVWKPDFNMALRARPEFTGGEVGAMENNFGTENCSACGRSGHPAKYVSAPFLSPPFPPVMQLTNASSGTKSDSREPLITQTSTINPFSRM